MTLYEAEGKKVRITLKNGHVYEGVAFDYTSAYDNDPDPESISMPPFFELFAPEIAKIEEIK